jgi:hypothetical protein
MHNHHYVDRIRSAATYVGEMVFVLDTFFVALMAGGLALGLNPLVSPGLTVLLALTPFIALGHHRWFERHRAEILCSASRHADRERRGF